MLNVVCCVCGTLIGLKDGEGVAGVSHTYCGLCQKEVLKMI